MILKVIKVGDDNIHFDNGYTLSSSHDQDCCESHFLNFNDTSIEDFEGLQFDMSGDKFFNRIEGYGIELMPIHGHSVKIAGYGSNNGYYSSELTLVLSDERGKTIKTFDISECQEITE